MYKTPAMLEALAEIKRRLDHAVSPVETHNPDHAYSKPITVTRVPTDSEIAFAESWLQYHKLKPRIIKTGIFSAGSGSVYWNTRPDWKLTSLAATPTYLPACVVGHINSVWFETEEMSTCAIAVALAEIKALFPKELVQ